MIGKFQAYLRTSFRFTASETRHAIRVGEPFPAPELLSAERRRHWAYVSACNPNGQELSESENRARRRRLKHRLDCESWEYFEGAGVPDGENWDREPSLLVVGADHEQAVELAREFGQDAVVAPDEHGVARLLDCRRPKRQIQEVLEGSNPCERLLSALFARGFLVEHDAQRCRVSDNALGDDSDDLDRVLRRAGLEQTARFFDAGNHKRKRLGRSIREDLERDAQLEDALLRIMTWRPHWQEESGPERDSDWASFVERRHGKKVRVGWLDAGIAALVKALNAAGAASWMSCAGQGQWTPEGRKDSNFVEMPFVEFSGPYFTWWAQAIFSALEIPGGTHNIPAEAHVRERNTWRLPEQTPPRYIWSDDALALHLPLQTQPLAWTVPVARAIYGKRRKLRRLRRTVINGATGKDSRHPPFGDLPLDEQLARLQRGLAKALETGDVEVVP